MKSASLIICIGFLAISNASAIVKETSPEDMPQGQTVYSGVREVIFTTVLSFSYFILQNGILADLEILELSQTNSSLLFFYQWPLDSPKMFNTTPGKTFVDILISYLVLN